MKTNNPQAIVIHHEAGNNGFNSVNQMHRQKWNFVSSLGFYIGYQYYINKDGILYKGREETDEGAHTLGGWNRKSIGICLMGNFEFEHPAQKQLDTLEKLIVDIQERRNILDTEIYGHRELWPTKCPGKFLFLWLTNFRKTNKLESKINKLQKILISLLTQLLNKLSGK